MQENKTNNDNKPLVDFTFGCLINFGIILSIFLVYNFISNGKHNPYYFMQFLIATIIIEILISFFAFKAKKYMGFGIVTFLLGLITILLLIFGACSGIFGIKQ